MKNELASFLLAVQFLTRLPVPTDKIFTPQRLTSSVKYYPLVGIVIGTLSAAVYWAATAIFAEPIAVLFAIASGLLFTGAFHEDGLADTFDGIGGGQSREQSLEIMKDSRLGTYGTTALVLALAVKAAALITLPSTMVGMALICGHGLSRLSSILVISSSQYVREEGTAKPVAEGISRIGLITASITGGAILFLWAFIFPIAFVIWGIAGLILGHGLMRLFYERKLRGYTGDTLGAVQQASEIGFYLGLAAWI